LLYLASSLALEKREFRGDEIQRAGTPDDRPRVGVGDEVVLNATNSPSTGIADVDRQA
jgi:hypothetical protein